MGAKGERCTPGERGSNSAFTCKGGRHVGQCFVRVQLVRRMPDFADLSRSERMCLGGEPAVAL